ncbi:hypothetical protein CCR75_008402 [Bremia lactucae]|uniref:Uncharacterized protein n=1 Tax=Bremia lactucae TaxID=4779 RepID=A0A976FKW5_BRELC|nr:hypothetical protein CCR75_008402 [Bremia lactucae]
MFDGIVSDYQNKQMKHDNKLGELLAQHRLNLDTIKEQLEWKVTPKFSLSLTSLFATKPLGK